MVISSIKRNFLYYFHLLPLATLRKKNKTPLESNLYLFTNGREGITLLMESLNKAILNSASIWEPLAGKGRKLDLDKLVFTNA